MNKVLAELIIGFNTIGNVQKDAIALLNFHGHQDIAEHCIKVANEASRIAHIFGIDEYKAFVSGCLHDVSRIFPDDKMINICHELEIDILKEEYIVPSLLHSKISKVMASEMFCIKDKEILSAIECHSTLKANAGTLDMVLFVADKTSWDNVYNKEFVDDIVNGLEKSLEHGAFGYLKYMFMNRERMKAFHPWTLEAYSDLLTKVVY